MIENFSEVSIPVTTAELDGLINIPSPAAGIVVFAHGSGSSRFSQRNQYVASVMQAAGLATLLFDLLTPDEPAIDTHTREYRFDIPLLSNRLVHTIGWLAQSSETQDLAIGLFGASTGAAAALIAAAERDKFVSAVVSRGGRVDLAGEYLAQVRAPTLLIVGSLDAQIMRLNRAAAAKLRCENVLEEVPGATHLFGEPGKLTVVAELARDWLVKWLT